METIENVNPMVICPLFLLPIREAYEWKRQVGMEQPIPTHPCFQFVKRMNGNVSIGPLKATLTSFKSLLPIREAYEWKHLRRRPSFLSVGASFLLPIREAYEWKQNDFCVNYLFNSTATCFQFVKRMNGNPPKSITSPGLISPCFQFVKRMNGNDV